jgi:hypothetical protein
MAYCTQMGCELLQNQRLIPQIHKLQWHGTLLSTFTFPWKDNWKSERASKEAGLISQIWHCAMAVNEWRATLVEKAIEVNIY